eukprot:TRINITY_DN2660_c0_g1_i7.p1 TRINITY_DN2660_c0_g1~~TRINITY_DN2660_c0_g1_i7.p1  ORF type:complete len:168 (+),score=6.02 TRINITY_DN2660_c0_g1_i7:763-1266(+)
MWAGVPSEPLCLHTQSLATAQLSNIHPINQQTIVPPLEITSTKENSTKQINAKQFFSEVSQKSELILQLKIKLYELNECNLAFQNIEIFREQINSNKNRFVIGIAAHNHPLQTSQCPMQNFKQRSQTMKPVTLQVEMSEYYFTYQQQVFIKYPIIEQTNQSNRLKCY